MPLVHSSTYRIRHYECNAAGYVAPANYLRFMQESAYDASAAAGYDMVGYATLNRLWFIRETDIQFFKHMYYGDEVIVRTWVEDFRRVRSIRAYEFRSIKTDERVALGWSDWIYLDPETQTPSSIPDEIVKVFEPRVVPPASLPRQRFPEFPDTAVNVIRIVREVAWHDLDALKHTNNAVYLTYFEEAALNANDQFNWSKERFTQENISLTLRRAHIEYLQPARLGDSISIDTWISSIQTSELKRHFVVWRESDEVVLCQAYLDYAWTDLGNGRAQPISKAFLTDFAAHISEAAGE